MAANGKNKIGKPSNLYLDPKLKARATAYAKRSRHGSLSALVTVLLENEVNRSVDDPELEKLADSVKSAAIKLAVRAVEKSTQKKAIMEAPLPNREAGASESAHG